MNGVRRWFANTRVWKKILTGYLAVLLLFAAMAVIVVVQTSRMQDLNATTRYAIDNLRLIDNLELALANRTAAFRDFLVSGQEIAAQSYEEQTRGFESLLAALEPRLDAADRSRLETLRAVSDAWHREVVVPGIALRRDALQPEGPPLDSVATFFRSSNRELVTRAKEELATYRAEEERVTEEARNRRDDAIRQVRDVTLFSALLAVFLSIVLASWIASIIARGIHDAVAFAGSVAGGDLTRTLDQPGSDEVGELIGTLNRMAGDLRTTVSGVAGAAAQVATSAEEIAASAEEIAFTSDRQVRSTEETSTSMEQIAAQIARVYRSTESLASSVEQTTTSVTQMSNSIEQTATSAETLGASVEQTSATIEEMVASIGQVGRHVEETREIARSAESDARTGGDAVQSTIDGMRRIHREMDDLRDTVRQLGTAGASVARISEVIEDIADQTNLLALNASIEAARAGEHGRGFSVVAQEIRRLAERSVESTREIGQTIREVIDDMDQVVRSSDEVAERTNDGIRLADSAGVALEKIITSAGRTRSLMEEVALATRQQITAASQAQEAIRHIQHVAFEVRIATREQANGSRQIAEAVENMNRQTREVFAATAEQQRGGEMVLEATEQISEGARTTQSAIQEMAGAAQDLSSQANRLTELVASFRV
jgi:methyl-accepting chemotaxis protein